MKIDLTKLKNLNPYLVMIIVVIIAFIIFLIIITGGYQKLKPSISTQLSEVQVREKVFFPHMAKNGQTIFFFGDQGIKLKKFDLKTAKTTVVYPGDIYYTTKTLWSPDGTKVIIKNNNQNIQTNFRLFNLETNQLKDLDKNIENVIWSQDGQKIYYHYLDNNNGQNYLAVANFDGTSAQKIIDSEFLSYDFIWLNNFQQLGFWSVPGDSSGTRLKSLSLADKTVKEIFSDFRLSNALSSPNGEYLLYNRFYEKNATTKISFSKADGSQNHDLKINTNLNKAVWLDNTAVILAIPGNTGENDTIAKIDIPSGKENDFKYQKGLKNIFNNIGNLQLSSDNKTLYFTSNDLLYKLELQ